MPKNKAKKGNPVRGPYDLKVQVGGNTHLLSVGKLLPHDWNFTRVTVTSESEGEIWLKLERLSLSTTTTEALTQS